MVKRDLQGWKLSRCIWVMDRGMNSEENRIILQRAGGIISLEKGSGMLRAVIKKPSPVGGDIMR